MRAPRGSAARKGVLAAGLLAVGAALVSCSHPDPVEALKADRPLDARADAACRSYLNGKDEKYLLAAQDSTVGPVRTHMVQVMSDSAVGQRQIALVDGHPEDQYVALCLLQSTASSLPTLTPSVEPFTLALLRDGTSFWADSGSSSG